MLDLFGTNATRLDVPFLMYRRRRWATARPGRPDLAGDFQPRGLLVATRRSVLKVLARDAPNLNAAAKARLTGTLGTVLSAAAASQLPRTRCSRIGYLGAELTARVGD